MKLWLVSHAANAALRAGTFAAAARDGRATFDTLETLDARAVEAVAAWRERWLARWSGEPLRAIASPAAIALATAQAAGFADDAIERTNALAEADFGAWQARRLVDVARETPDALAAWTRDPAFRPPGGESFDDVRARVGAWLDAPASRVSSPDATVVAFTHASVIRAAILHALDAPSAGFRAIEIAPLAVTVLRKTREGWVWVAAD